MNRPTRLHSRTRRVAIVALAALAVAPLSLLQAQDPAPQAESAITTEPAAREKAKPLSEFTTKGLAYLIEQQDASGGWGQGGGWRQPAQGGRSEGAQASDPPDLGNTCIATLALIRAGNTPQEGAFAKNVTKAVEFICTQVEKSDTDSMYVTDVRDSQLQRKIGQYVDTFLVTLVLSELKDKMPADGSDKRVATALKKTVRKIESNQQNDGTFAGNTGWASVLSQSICTKALARAAQNGADVKVEVLARDFAQSVAGLDKATGEFKAAAAMPAAMSGKSAALTGIGAGAAGVVSDAGITLYAAAGNAGRIADQANNGLAVEQKAKAVLADVKSSKDERQRAEEDLGRVKEIRAANEVAMQGIVRKLDDKQFIAGFGNNGGEEFLSYMNISETLVSKGGTEWLAWDKSIAENLNRVQNKDGSWSGDHCITGRTFCTATALLTLMADRAPAPLAAKIKKQS